MGEKKKEKLCCILFFVILYAMWIGDIISADRLYSEWEKRRLAQKPEFSYQAVVDGSYGEAYEKWLTDQFPGRDYWVGIKKLLTPEALLIKGASYLRPEDPNPVKAYATGFLKNGKLQRAKIKAHSCYTYGVLREEVQEHILDKLQLMLDRRVVKGIYENGTEYTVIATVLHMNKDILRMLQKFDFTKKNPKIVFINTTEAVLTLEDSILMAFLNLAGFDIVFFVPTGYQCVERYFNSIGMEEHQIGEYVYDLRIPDFDTISNKTRQSWRERLFKRGD